MKWVEFIQDDADHKTGEVAQIEDGEYVTLKRLKFIKDSAEPAEVAGATTAIADGLKAYIDSGIESRLAGALEALKPKGPIKRPGVITTHDNALDDPKCGFKSLGDFSKSVMNASQKTSFDERLKISQKANGASEDINADGGYATPIEFATSVYDDIMAQDSLMADTWMIPMGSNSIKLPAINYLTQGAYGVTANWEGEGQTIPTSKPKYRQPQLTLNKLTALVPVTSELMEDGIAIEGMIDKLAAEAIKFKVNDAILNGTGAGMPTGIIGHASTATVTRTTALATAALDLLTMRSRLYSTGGAKFYINKDVEPALLTAADPAGRYLYFAPGSFPLNPAVGGATEANGRLFGSEVKPVYNCQSLGTAGDIIYANLKGYAFGYKATGINKAMSIHLYFATDEIAFRWTMRCDGRPWRDTTLAAAKGSATYGSAVTLTTKLS